MSLRDVRRRVDSVLPVLVAITVLGLVARLVRLGDRIAHWDEGRVGYEILGYMATGTWEYRPIVHGPFLPQVNKHVFALLGASDFTGRLVVAFVAGLLPLSAWLYREHLRDAELVALAVFLAADPILLYYSRFMRNDLLVATFAFAGLGLYVRLLDTGRARYLYAGTALWALAFTAKENALLYVAAILGGLVLLFDHRLFLARTGEARWSTVARGHLADALRGLWRYKLPIAVAAVEFLVIIVYFYAPRAGSTAGIGLWKAFGQPGMFPAVIEAGTIGAGEEMVSSWIGGSHQDHPFLPFLGDYVETLGQASGPLALLAVLGFVSDRYAGEEPRDLVALGFYWGIASIVGYPIAIDIKSAWAVTHAVLPLAIPAAAGAALIYRWGRDAFDEDDRVGVGLALLVLLAVGGQMAATGVSTSYLAPQSQDNVMVQYAQPEGEMRPALAMVERAAADNDGLDVLWYGDHFYVEREAEARRLPIGDGQWYNRLPLPWYLEQYGATVNSTNLPGQLERRVAAERPPVIITREQEATAVRTRTEDYREFSYEGRQFSLTFVIFVDAEYVDG